MQFNNTQIERYARQISLKKIGVNGQKKILGARVLIVGIGGLGSPAAIYLASMGVGKIGIVDFDKVDISNLHRQILFENKDIKKQKVSAAINKLKKINPSVNLIGFNKKLSLKNISSILEKFDIVIDGTDNFKTRFLLNDYCYKNKKILISGAISKFNGYVYTFNFKKKKSPCLRCFMPEIPRDDENDCEINGVVGPLAGVVGSIQANEVIKEIVEIGQTLCGYILIIDMLNLSFRKVKLNKNPKCRCNAKNI